MGLMKLGLVGDTQQEQIVLGGEPGEVWRTDEVSGNEATLQVPCMRTLLLWSICIQTISAYVTHDGKQRTKA